VQIKSYEEFFAEGYHAIQARGPRLQAVFKEVFPISSYDEKMTLNFTHYEIGEPKLSPIQAIRDAESFSAPLYVTYELKDEAGAKQERVYMGEMPMMTTRGTFVITAPSASSSASCTAPRYLL